MAVGTRVELLDLGVRWDPNVPDALLVQHASLAVLVTRAHFDDSDQRRIALRFGGCRVAVLGPPNDEARHGHRLWQRGLSDCLWAGEVRDSDWVEELETRNRVHARHKPESYADLRHVVLLLKESTFECVSRTIEIDRLEAGAVNSTDKILGRHT